MPRRLYRNPSAKQQMEALAAEPEKPAWVEAAEEVVGVFDPEAGQPSADPFQIEGDGYEEMTVAELKQILREEGLSTSGNKAELIARLRVPISDSEPATAEEAPAEEEEAVPTEVAAVEEAPVGEVSESKEDSAGQEPANE